MKVFFKWSWCSLCSIGTAGIGPHWKENGNQVAETWRHSWQTWVMITWSALPWSTSTCRERKPPLLRICPKISHCSSNKTVVSRNPNRGKCGDTLLDSPRYFSANGQGDESKENGGNISLKTTEVLLIKAIKHFPYSLSRKSIVPGLRRKVLLWWIDSAPKEQV